MHEWDKFNQANDSFPDSVGTLDNGEVIETALVARNHD